MAYRPGQRKRPKSSDLVHPELSSLDRYRKHYRVSYLLSLANRRATKRGWEFDLEVGDLPVPTHCPLLGIELDNYSDNVDVRMSIDRIDSSKGYIKGNVLIVSHRANRLKNNATSDELLLLATNLKQIENSI